MLAHAAALLCALSAVTFAASGEEEPRRVAAVTGAAGFIVGALWLQPSPSVVGALVVLSAGVLLRWPRFWRFGAVVGGVTAGLWSAILSGQGLPMWSSWGLAAALPLASAWLAARHATFAPAVLREGALLTIGGLGLVVAAGPSIVEGWGSASALNLEPAGGVRQAVGVWVIVLTAMSVSLGGWHALRRRR